jgi:transcriptional regulator with XRE-family HTH domain
VNALSRTRHHRESSDFRRVATSLARTVRLLRRQKRWTVEAAAERFGVEPAYVRSIEAGRTNPSLAVLVSIASAFGLLPGELLLRNVRPSEPRE